jgi:hypothetical protein
MSDAEYTEAVVRTNAKLVATQTVARSPIVKRALDEHHIKVVAARYAIDSGRVTLL